MSRMKEIGIICITALGAVALFKGIDGVIFGAVIAAIAGIAGYETGKRSKT